MQLHARAPRRTPRNHPRPPAPAPAPPHRLRTRTRSGLLAIQRGEQFLDHLILPSRVLDAVAAAMFVAGGIYALIESTKDEEVLIDREIASHTVVTTRLS